MQTIAFFIQKVIQIPLFLLYWYKKTYNNSSKINFSKISQALGREPLPHTNKPVPVFDRFFVVLQISYFCACYSIFVRCLYFSNFEIRGRQTSRKWPNILPNISDFDIEFLNECQVLARLVTHGDTLCEFRILSISIEHNHILTVTRLLVCTLGCTIVHSINNWKHSRAILVIFPRRSATVPLNP